MKKFYPLLMDLDGVNCVVIGGGEVACRKVLLLMESGAQVTVISPEINGPLARLVEKNQVCWKNRVYRDGDLKGCRLAYLATNSSQVSAIAAREAAREGILVNVADNPSQGNFIVPSVIRRGDLSICISTNGKSPLLAKRIRQQLESLFGPEYGEFIKILGRERERALQEIPEEDQRRAYFSRLVDSGLIDLIKEGRVEEIARQLTEIWQEGNKNT